MLTNEQIVPPHRREMLAGALGAPVGEIAMLQNELQQARQQAAALQRDLLGEKQGSRLELLSPVGSRDLAGTS